MNKIVSILLVTFLILSIQIVSAQKQSAVYLKNGSIIYGKVLESIPDSIVKLQDKCDNIWVFEQSKIQSVNAPNKIYITEASPFQLSFNMGIAGFGGSYDTGLSLLISGIYHFNDRYYAGITSGVEHFEIPLLPIAAEFHADAFKRKTTPYIYLRAGYGFKLIEDEENNNYTAEYKGGPMFGAGIGIKKRFSSEFAMTFSIGYRHQQTYEARDYLFNDWWSSDYKRHYFNNRTTFRVGFVF